MDDNDRNRFNANKETEVFMAPAGVTVGENVALLAAFGKRLDEKMTETKADLKTTKSMTKEEFTKILDDILNEKLCLSEEEAKEVDLPRMARQVEEVKRHIDALSCQ